MREVSISQLWGRSLDLLKVNLPLFVILLVSLPSIIVILICIIVILIFHFIPIYLDILVPIVLLAYILLMPVLVRAGYLVARQGQSSFGEVFKDLSSLLKILSTN
jgi:hypothetical protein